MSPEDATIEIIHNILKTPDLYEKLTGLKHEIEVPLEVIKEQIQTRKVNSQQIIAALKAMCAIVKIVDDDLCPLIQGL